MPQKSGQLLKFSKGFLKKTIVQWSNSVALPETSRERERERGQEKTFFVTNEKDKFL
jgi:hypothetical protein